MVSPDMSSASAVTVAKGDAVLTGSKTVCVVEVTIERHVGSFASLHIPLRDANVIAGKADIVWLTLEVLVRYIKLVCVEAMNTVDGDGVTVKSVVLITSRDVI